MDIFKNKYKIIIFLLFTPLVFYFCFLGKPPGKINFVVLCSVEKENDKFQYRIEKIIINQSRFKINLKSGELLNDKRIVSQSQSDQIFPNKIIICYHVYKKPENNKLFFELVETSAVINEKIPAKNDITLLKYYNELTNNTQSP